MHEEKPFRSGSDPLRYVDARFEPVDPIFDADELTLQRPARRRSRRATIAAAAFLGTMLACGGSDPVVTRATDSILVQLEPGAAPPGGAEREGQGPPILALSAVASEDDAPLLRVPIEAGTDPTVAAEQASTSEGVAFAEPVYLYQPSKTPGDPRFKDLWGLAKIEAPAAWSRSTGDRGVVVAVVDDGVALDHPDLKPNLWKNDQESEDGVDDDLDGYVDDVRGWDFVDDDPDPSPAASGEERWHGTHVAGTIGAAGDNDVGVVGVNWKVSLMPLRAIGPHGGRSDALAKAIDFAADHGARVINASWGGGGTSKVISAAVARAAKKGVLFVAAAGNDSAASPSFPANLTLDNLISVGASTPADTLAPFSDRGAMVAAPGVGILSTTAPGRYERYDGTSMAAPHVSGLAALLWAVHPDASLAQVRKAILDSGVRMSGVAHGRIDASRALTALDAATGGTGAALKLSRTSITFKARPGRTPKAQTISVRAEGGGARPFTATADESWIVLPKARAETPARFAVKIDPARLAAGTHQGHVTFKADGSDTATLAVTAVVGDGVAVAVTGAGCELRDGRLHVRAGAGCAVHASEGEAAAIQWQLPDGAKVSGGHLYGQFVRRGEFQVLLSSDEGATDTLAVVIE
jgi:hypothetical protein